MKVKKLSSHLFEKKCYKNKDAVYSEFASKDDEMLK